MRWLLSAFAVLGVLVIACGLILVGALDPRADHITTVSPGAEIETGRLRLSFTEAVAYLRDDGNWSVLVYGQALNDRDESLPVVDETIGSIELLLQSGARITPYAIGAGDLPAGDAPVRKQIPPFGEWMDVVIEFVVSDVPSDNVQLRVWPVLKASNEEFFGLAKPAEIWEIDLAAPQSVVTLPVRVVE